MAHRLSGSGRSTGHPFCDRRGVGAEKSNTFDEPLHITCGYSYWTLNDYRLHPDNGILPQRLFALPLLTLHPRFPKDPAAWLASDKWSIAHQFFFECSNDADQLLRRARCMAAIVSVGLGLLVYTFWSDAVRLCRSHDFLAGLCDRPDHLWPTEASPPATWLRRCTLPPPWAALELLHELSFASFVVCWLALSPLMSSRMREQAFGSPWASHCCCSERWGVGHW